MVQVLIDKFKSIDKMIAIDGCHYWLGSAFQNGYGRLWFNGSNKYAHRISYAIHKGDTGGLFVCHSCDNRLCVNPDHLFLGTPKDNMQDKMKKGRCNPSSGSSHYAHKLTTDQINSVRALYCEGIKQYEIAEMFGVRQSAISRIVNFVRRKET